MDASSLALAGICSPPPESPPKTNPIGPPSLTLPSSSATTPATSTSAPQDKPPNTSTSTPKNTVNKGGRKAPSGGKKSAKRKISSSGTPRDQRLRPRVSTSTPSNKTSTGEQEPISIDLSDEMEDSSNNNPDIFEKLQKYMDAQFKKLSEDVTEVKADMASMKTNLSDQVQRNAQNIEKITQEIGTNLDQKIAQAVSAEVQKFTKGLDKIRAVQAVREQAGSTRPAPENNEDDNRYWRSRRSLRCWPVRGPPGELWGNVGDFFHQIMDIPTNNLTQESVETIRRISTGRNSKGKIRDEVLVVFCDVSTRDMVLSYASNLSRHRDQAEPPGVRLDIPDQLTGQFKTLSAYGHLLRKKLGPGLRRSIKFEDTSKSMYIDACFPGDETWTRISLEVAKEELDKEKEKEASQTRTRIDSLSRVPAVDGQSALVPRPAPTNSVPQSQTLQRFNNPTAGPSRWTNKR